MVRAAWPTQAARRAEADAAADAAAEPSSSDEGEAPALVEAPPDSAPRAQLSKTEVLAKMMEM